MTVTIQETSPRAGRLAFGNTWSAQFKRGGDPESSWPNADAILIPHDSSFNFLAAMTLEAWVWIPALPLTGVVYPHVCVKGPTTNLALPFILFYSEDGSGLIYARIRIGGAYKDTTYAGILRSQWMHLAMTYNNTALKLIRNGTEVASVNYTGDMDTDGNSVVIGSAPKIGPFAFGGLISDVRLWNIARSAATINAQKSQRLVGNESGLVGYWPLNEGHGRVAASLVGSPGKDGASQNCDIWTPQVPF